MKINNSLISLYEKAHNLDQDKISLFEQISSIDLRYLKSSPVDQGGMKKIQSIRDDITGRNVAMAVIAESNPNQQVIENFLREARITASLQHPNIVPIYDIGIHKDSQPYFTMKLLEGLTLDQYLATEPPFISLIEIFKKICDGMAYAHSKGVIHLDLKPENIYIGNFGDVIICDWGLARIFTTDEDRDSLADDESLDISEISHLTLNGQIKGTPGFMAPEQIKSKSYKDQKTDIFSLGALLFYMLTKTVPFIGKNFEETRQKTLQETPIIPIPIAKNIPLSLQAIFYKAMEKEPSQRYSSVNEIITEIDSYQQGFATHAENAGLLRQLQLMIKRHKVIFSAAALIFCILSLGLLLFIKQQENNFSIISAKEKTAREALNKYEMERNEKLLVQAESASRYFFKAEKFFQDLHFKKALEEVNKALLFKPDMKNSNALKAKILLAFYRIEEAIPYFKKADQYQKGFFRPLTDFCLPRIDPKTGRLNHDDYLSLIKMTPEPNTVVKYMMEDVFAQKMKRQERLRLVREILLIRNPEITQLNFTFNEQENSLSLKDNPSLTNIDSLKFSKISNLNLSNTAISSLERIKNLKLQGLNISKTYISTLDELKKMPLTHLNISNTGITDIDSISQLPLTHLNIHNTRVTNLSVLQNMPSLIEVKANWHQFPQDKIKLKGVAR